MTQTALISFLALAETKMRDVRGVLTYSVSPQLDLAGLIWLTFITPGVTPWQGSTDLRLNHLLILSFSSFPSHIAVGRAPIVRGPHLSSS